MSGQNSKLVLRRNKTLDVIYHAETNLVFNNASDKLLIAKISDNQVVELDDEDVETCKKLGFKYDETKVMQQEEVEEQEPEQEEVEQEQPDEQTQEEVEQPVTVEQVKPKDRNNNSLQELLSKVENLFSARDSEYSQKVESLETENSSLKSELETLKKEHEATKKKLKNVLLAMQENL
jgi:hypothetical protein